MVEDHQNASGKESGFDLTLLWQTPLICTRSFLGCT